MTNIVEIEGPIPYDRKIKDMIANEVGYTVPWAYQGGQLNEDFIISKKGGTATLRVKCVQPGLYSIRFENHERPKSRPMARRRSRLHRLLGL
jgi:hypothetical protein